MVRRGSRATAGDLQARTSYGEALAQCLKLAIGVSYKANSRATLADAVGLALRLDPLTLQLLGGLVKVVDC